MAPQGVGYEDFDVLEECQGKRNPSHHKPQTPTTHIHYQQHHMTAPKKEIINSYDAAKIYGGLLIVDNRRNKIPPRRETIDCIEAAKKYDGVVLMDCRYKPQPLRKPYY